MGNQHHTVVRATVAINTLGNDFECVDVQSRVGLIQQSKLALLDETDSGLDIDALKVVAEGVNRYRRADNGVVLITHYQRLLDYIVPDFVHVLSNGKIIESGDKSLARDLSPDSMILPLDSTCTKSGTM